MKKILIISFSNISQDPRVMRQITILSKYCNINVVGYGHKPEFAVSFFEMIKSQNEGLSKVLNAARLLLHCYDNYYYKKYIQINDESFQKLKNSSFDLVVANDISALPLAFELAGQASILLDAHEYSPREFEDKMFWPLLYGRYYHYLCATYLSKVAGMMTVCHGIADEYERNFGVKSVVVTNAPSYRSLSPTPVQPNIIRMIHHGGAIPSRHLEEMIELMNYLDERFSLDFMLVPSNPKYLDQLKFKAAKNERIRFVDPVAMEDIPDVCNKYDVGLYLLPPVSFNSKHALPNKFFEFIQARLALAIGPSPEMARIVKEYDCGIVASSFAPKDLANKMNALTEEQIRYFKDRSHLAAKELCAEANAQTIINLVEGV